MPKYLFFTSMVGMACLCLACLPGRPLIGESFDPQFEENASANPVAFPAQNEKSSQAGTPTGKQAADAPKLERSEKLKDTAGEVRTEPKAEQKSVDSSSGSSHCVLCECHGTHKVCRLVCEEKKVAVTCWGIADEDFCVNGPSIQGCKHCESVCAECAKPGEPRTGPKLFPWTTWSPKGSPTIYTKHKLMKKTITKTVPTYKWVVEDLCESCQTAMTPTEVPSDVSLPKLPKLPRSVTVIEPKLVAKK